MPTRSVLIFIVVVCIIVIVCLGLYALWKLYWRMAYTRFDIDTCLPCTRNQLIGSIVCIIILVTLLHTITPFIQVPLSVQLKMLSLLRRVDSVFRELELDYWAVG